MREPPSFLPLLPSLSSTLVLPHQQSLLKISSHRVSCRTTRIFWISLCWPPLAEARGRISDIRTIARTWQPSFCAIPIFSLLHLPVTAKHLLFLDEHFSQQSTWTNSARSADSPPPTTTRWSSRSHWRHPLLDGYRSDSRLALSARYRLAIGSPSPPQCHAPATCTKQRRQDSSTDWHTPARPLRPLHGPHQQQQQHRTPATAPPRPRQRNHTHLRAPAHTCTTPRHPPTLRPWGCRQSATLGHRRQRRRSSDIPLLHPSPSNWTLPLTSFHERLGAHAQIAGRYERVSPFWATFTQREYNVRNLYSWLWYHAHKEMHLVFSPTLTFMTQYRDL